MATWLDAAVLLGIDAFAMAASAAAMVHGFDTLAPEVRLCGVLSNRIASPKHYEYVRQAIAARCRPESIGYLPRDASLALPERHLGLHLAAEALTDDRLRRLAECVESHVDLDRLLDLGMRPRAAAPAVQRSSNQRVRIGIARDRAFCFYYEDNLALLRELGAELVEFSPIADTALPAGLDGIYLGGGYPELHAEALSANTSMREAMARFVDGDAPVYAECGG